ncbi:MAG: dTDP-glucose pyrophosphorylase [Thermoanaerobaculia bacterium]
MTSYRPVIGLVPAAGAAQRLGRLPCSKEILPVGVRSTPEGPRPRVICERLFEGFRRAGIVRSLVVLRRDKWDVAAHLGDGRDLGLHLAYLAIDATAGVPETLDRAFPFVEGFDVALGFPDTWFTPGDAYVHLLRRLREAPSKPQVVLGCVPSDRSEKTDMVDADGAGKVRRIVVKEKDTGLRYAWIVAVWTPLFSAYLHEYLADPPAGRAPGEIYPGHVFQAAIDDGVGVEAVMFPDGHFLDVGTPEDLARALESRLADT